MANAGGPQAPDDGIAAVETELLGGERRYTRLEVAELAGVSVENARLLWRALGFADVGDDNVAFTDRDVEALQTVQLLRARGLIDDQTELAMTRAMGQALARLAEWQVTAITAALADEAAMAGADPADAARELVPVMESLIGYVWRRHLAATAGRMLAQPGETVGGSMTVGFADLVGYTSLTRSVGEQELAHLVEQFEQLAVDVIAELGGRIIKTVGDEVMFAADSPQVGAEIALCLLERIEATPDLPDLRIGLACGAVLARLGDLYGEPVNLAARLTSTARPDSILVDRELATAIEADPRFRLRRVAPRPVRGYAMLQPMRLRRASSDQSDAD